MNDIRKISVTILGRGAVGEALLHFFRNHSFPVRSVWNSRGGRVYTLAGEAEEPVPVDVDATFPREEKETGRLLFITTPDDLIFPTAEKLAAMPVDWSRRGVVHCSGNLTSDELAPLSGQGAQTAAMHPLQTFTRGDGSGRFRNITVSLEGDQALVSRLIPVVKKMKARPLILNRQQKRSLHIGAVFASNYLVSLLHRTETYLAEEGIPDSLDILEPLVKQTLDNILTKGSTEALTGPVARGDMNSIRRHLESLENNRDLLQLYKVLGREALRISRTRREMPEDVLRKMEFLFSDAER